MVRRSLGSKHTLNTNLVDMNIHIFFRVYLNIVSTLESIGLQTVKTLTAIQNSFKEDHLQLFFYEGSMIPQLSSHPVFSNSDKHKWTYDTKTRTFTYKVYREIPRHLPYISMILQHKIYNKFLDQDLSEWIESVKVVSPEDIFLPIYVIITSWAYSEKKHIDYSIDNYTVSAMTENGDEIIV